MSFLVEKSSLQPFIQREPDDAFFKEQELIFSWLLQKKEGTTRRNYEREVRSFFQKFPGLSLKEISVGHLSVFLTDKAHLKESSQRIAKDTISSLLNFCVKVGYLDRNPAQALSQIKVPEKTAFRILSEAQVFRLIECEENPRNKLILKLLYYSGLRVSELCNLCWDHFQARTQGVQLVVIGKGSKARSLLISNDLYQDLESLKRGEHDRVFQSREGTSITPTQVLRIVKQAGARAKINAPVSPHWLRHCHATHALERGAPIHVVQKTLGHADLSTTGKYLNAMPLDSSGTYLMKTK